jgi:membrane-bound serine protease (ClpP class)
VLFVLELKLPSHGILTIGGMVALLMGTIILFPPLRPTFPGIRNTVEPAVIASTVGVTVAFFVIVARFALRHHGSYIMSEPARLVGATGVAKSEIGPSGIAHVGGEDWTVLSEGVAIPKGQRVRVKRVDSLRLIVEPATDAPSGSEGGD